ncbi:MAG: hypothetical protein KDA96_19060, partial [Planctomycetaceae bacterium]|nr:hypothetical protein [Planctomycetaceae bacterium]
MITPGQTVTIRETVFKDDVPTNPDSMTAVLYRNGSASGATVTVTSTGVAGVYTFAWTNNAGWARTDELELETRPTFSDKHGGAYIP